MANPQDLETLCQGPRIWNAWREENSGRVPDLRDARLTLSQRQLGPSNGGPVNFRHADLDGAEFRHATLIGADLQRANLVSADLVHARLDGANLAGADLTDAVIDYADLTGANLDGAILIGASFTNARGLTQEQIAAAYGNSSTVLPAALLPPESWFPSFDDDRFAGYPAPSLIYNKDPYDVLGVDRLATAEEIRAAFRNLVKKVHPDINPDDAQAQEAFKRVSIAYRILGNPDKRSLYDKGEIDGEGEVSREFEARRQFRRYAFRFYAAAAASLLLAIGALGTVWHTFLTQQDAAHSRVEIAVAAPPKQVERLAPPSIGKPAVVEIQDERAAPQGALGSGTDVAAGEESSPPVADVPSNLQETAAVVDGELNAKFDDAQSPLGIIEQAADESPPDPHDGQTRETTVAGAAEDEHADGQAASDPVAMTAVDSADPIPAEIGDAADTAMAESGEIAATQANGHLSGTQAAPSQTVEASEPEVERLASLTEASGDLPSKTIIGDPPAIAPAAPSGDAAPAGAPPGEAAHDTAGPATPPQSEEQTIAPPLREAYRQEEAAESPRDAFEREPSLDRKSLARSSPPQSPHSEILLPKTNGRQLVKDPISELFRHRAIQEALERKADQATASVDSIPAPNQLGEQEEIWDLYSHSIPEADEDADRPWPESLTTKKKKAERKPAPPTGAAVSGSTRVTARKQAPRTAAPAAAAGLRKQAVSDILSGGL